MRTVLRKQKILRYSLEFSQKKLRLYVYKWQAVLRPHTMSLYLDSGDEIQHG